MRELARQLHELKGIEISMETGPGMAPGIGVGNISAISIFPKKTLWKKTQVKGAQESMRLAKELLSKAFPDDGGAHVQEHQGKHHFLGLLFSDIEPDEHMLRAQQLRVELEKLGHKHNILK